MAMNEFSKYIISPFKLNRIINSKQLKIIDCRWFINDKKKGNEEYEKKHIPGAIFFDLEHPVRGANVVKSIIVNIFFITIKGPINFCM